MKAIQDDDVIQAARLILNAATPHQHAAASDIFTFNSI
jgi:hypothetical protein